MKPKTSILLSLFLSVTLIITFAGFASADITIDFATGFADSQGGTISYAGGVTPLIGEHIVIGLVRGIDTPSNAGPAHAVGGSLGGWAGLDFTTGNFISFSGNLYTFGSGGALTITGTVPDAGINTDTLLLNASPISASFQVNTRELTVVLGNDTKDPDLLDYFGLPADTQFQIALGTIHTEDILAYNGDPYVSGGSFTSDDALSTDIPNAAVPEPATMLLLGSGLLGMGMYARRRFSKK